MASPHRTAARCRSGICAKSAKMRQSWASLASASVERAPCGESRDDSVSPPARGDRLRCRADSRGRLVGRTPWPGTAPSRTVRASGNRPDTAPPSDETRGREKGNQLRKNGAPLVHAPSSTTGRYASQASMHFKSRQDKSPAANSISECNVKL